ncbi:MAG TPA: helix-turn-helix domain-containing protein [Pseudonocardiaceae bacterium]|jgi:hypothetical protein
MRVRDLLDLPVLKLRPVWSEPAPSSRDITGVTVTDLAEPTRFVRPGDAVLTGLVWWSPGNGPESAERFVAAVTKAGAAALLAGEETHGEVPAALARACARHRLPLLAVPADIDFRAITDAIYLRQWGGLDASAGPALPERARQELDRLLAESAPLTAVLAAACAPLGDLACHVVTATGRTLASTATEAIAPEEDVRRRLGTTLRVASGASPYDTWFVHAPASVRTPPGALREIAEVVARFQRAEDERLAKHRRAANRLATAIATGAEDAALRSAVRSCGLPDHGPYLVHALALPDGAVAARALAEGLADFPCAAGVLPRGEAVAVQSGTAAARWAAVRACDPKTPLAVGTSTVLSGPNDLPSGLAQARHARAGGITSAAELSGFGALVAGLDPGLRAAYRERVLGPLLGLGRGTGPVLLDTVAAFLACDGSWTRTARTLHVHINTVHYRINQAQQLLRRDLSRLDDRLDLRAALLC